MIKYNHLVAKLVILHNVESMTLTLKDLKERGHHIDHDILKGLAPYSRFGGFRQNRCRPSVTRQISVTFNIIYIMRSIVSVKLTLLRI